MGITVGMEGRGEELGQSDLKFFVDWNCDDFIKSLSRSVFAVRHTQLDPPESDQRRLIFIYTAAKPLKIRW